MCQSCEKLGQRTFGEIVELAPVVPIRPHRDEIVHCIDSDSDVSRVDATEDQYGNWYSDSANLGECKHCDGLTDNDELSENDDYCEGCRETHYDKCEHCSCVVEKRDTRTDNNGNTYCDECYCELYTSCEGCSEELAYDDIARATDGCAYCSNCARNDDESEHDADDSWRGRDVYDEIGSRRKYGVELETSSSDGWSGWIENTPYGAKEDGSVSGKEFVSPILKGDDGLAATRNLCKYAKRNGCTVNRSCGYHLHIDLSNESDEELQAIALAYAYTSDFWFGCVDSGRRSNSYCHPNVQNGRVYWDVATIKDCGGKPDVSTRYVWLNWCAYDAHSTVEVRNHQGTLDGEEVCNWIKAHLRFVDYVKGLTVGQITRIFGNKTMKAQMRNMRDIWKDDALSDYYADKVGVDSGVYAA
jgi:Putative amidoligase enzyme